MEYIKEFKQLKDFSYNTNTQNDNKKLINVIENELDDFRICAITYILSNMTYESYLSIIYGNTVISCLLYKKFTDSKDNIKYFEHLKKLVNIGDISLILKECKK